MDDSAEDSNKVTVIVEPETPVVIPMVADPEPPNTVEAPKVETKAKPREKPADTPKEQVVDVDEYTCLLSCDLDCADADNGIEASGAGDAAAAGHPPFGGANHALPAEG